LKKNGFSQKFLPFLCGPLGEIKKKGMWDKQVFDFADGRVDRENKFKIYFAYQ